MKKLLLILFSLMLSFNSYGEWTFIGQNSDDDSFYIDLDRVKSSEGYVYWWDLGDWVEPYEDETGIIEKPVYSQMEYVQGECAIKRFKTLSTNFYEEPMGEELIYTFNDPEPLWDYFPPNSMGDEVFDISCRLMKAFEESSADQHQKIIEEFKVEIELERKKSEYEKLLKDEIKAEEEISDLLIVEDQLNTLRSAYVNNISARIKTFWRYQSAEDDWTCEVYVVQDRQGQVKAVDVRNCNVGDSARAKSFRDSIERAVYKASPLPAAPDEGVFDSEIYMLFSVN
jgi:hypothetical protein